MSQFKRIAVYCASSESVDQSFKDRARDLGSFLASQGIEVVYGGGGVGLMNQVAEGALNASGRVIGVIPKKLNDLELGRTDLSELHIVDSMHQRKAKMAELADGFIAMPGGFGTLEEIFEVTTWTQLRYHLKPVGLLNVNGFYDHILAFLQHAVAQGFIRELHKDLLLADTDPERLLVRMARSKVPALNDWIPKRES